MPDESGVLVQVDDVGPRVRAARAYAGLAVKDLADAIGMGVQTIKRIEAGARAPRLMEIWAIADVCGLPKEWFEMDFKAIANRAMEATELLERIDERLARLEAQLGISSRNGHGAQ